MDMRDGNPITMAPYGPDIMLSTFANGGLTVTHKGTSYPFKNREELLATEGLPFPVSIIEVYPGHWQIAIGKRDHDAE